LGKFLNNFVLAYSFIYGSVLLLRSAVKVKTGALLNATLYTVEPLRLHARYIVLETWLLFYDVFCLCYFQTQYLVYCKVTYSTEIL